ncbi:MAG: CoA transferase [Geodermatophilaceae bacterium]|nr:CoA transferase [Geodermatophilaceae bacterium]
MSSVGPLHGVRVLELAGLGPAPFGCMVLADLGADVVRVQRPGGGLLDVPNDPLTRGRRTLELDLKAVAHRDLVLALAQRADVLVEGFRPGVAERLGLGPEVCTAQNQRLVYARMTGWGQSGPLAHDVGHDINYLAVAGLLHHVGPAGGPPIPPLNLVADFGGGGMLLVVGVLAALVERARSGRGQLIDAAMVDGAALLGAFAAGLRAAGQWSDERGTNLLDGGAPFYRTYLTADRQYVAVGALEPQFYAALLDGLGLADAELPAQHDRAGWPVLAQRFAATFVGRTRDEWAALFAGTPACVSPVLTMGEAPEHPHNVERGTFVDLAGVRQPAPAPRFSRSEAGAGPGEDWSAWGIDPSALAELRRTGAVRPD